MLTAGVGVTLLTRRANANRTENPAAVSAKRWTLIRRGLALYGFGLVFFEIWSGSILPYYGAMFFIAAFLFTLATPWLVAIGVTSAVAGAVINWQIWERVADGHDMRWLTDPPDELSPRGLVYNLWVNDNHPLFPWLAFLCGGMILGRLLRDDSSTADAKKPEWWAPRVFGIGVVLFGAATLLSDVLGGDDATPLTAELASRHPLDRGLLYTASALGTALVAFTVVYSLGNRFVRSSMVRFLAHAGQMSLTLYVLHALVFIALVDVLGFDRARRTRPRPDVRRRLLDRGNHRRLTVAPRVRHRPG